MTNQQERDKPTQKGWECPKCGRINAPWVTTCPYHGFIPTPNYTTGRCICGTDEYNNSSIGCPVHGIEGYGK